MAEITTIRLDLTDDAGDPTWLSAGLAFFVAGILAPITFLWWSF